MAKSMGIPGLQIVGITHPLGGIPEDEVRKKAKSVISEIIDKATKINGMSSAGKEREGAVLKVYGSIYDVTSFCYSNGWTDGLPIFPPVVEAVQEMIEGTDLPPERVLGRMPPNEGIVTVEKIAINAVMAGCRPTYMPVLIAAIEGLLETDFDLAGVQTSTGPHSPLLIINGPIRHEIRINYSSGALGPGWQANAAIGRAIRFILNNIGGAKIGVTNMATLGMAENLMYCLGENEEKSPWDPFHVEQGFQKEESTVSIIGAYSPEHVSDHVGITPEEILKVAADVITKITRFHLLAVAPIIKKDFVLILCPEHAESIAKAGWSKGDVQKFLFANSKLSYETLKDLRRKVDPSICVESPAEGIMVPMFSGPEKIKLIVAGGPGKHSAYINTGHSKRIITKKVRFPGKWDKVIEKYKEERNEYHQ